jgi:uncharacterized protein (TIGR00730 family)
MSRITILGWKRNRLSDLLKLCEDLSYELAKLNFTVVTGGGGGFMEAGNKGAYNFDQNKSVSYGVNGLNECNPHTPLSSLYLCENFAVRKSMLLDTSDCLIFFPGGIGTLDEFMDTINLYKTGFRKVKPVICVGDKYWRSLKKWFEDNGQDFPDKYISLISEDLNEILKFIKNKLIYLKDD